MATTLVLVDSGAKATVYFLNLWNIEKMAKNKSTANIQMSRKFNLDISMVDHSQT